MAGIYRPEIGISTTRASVDVVRLDHTEAGDKLDVAIGSNHKEIVIDYRGAPQPVLPGGEGADTFLYEVAETVSALRVAVIVGGLAYHCDITNPQHAGQVVGIFETATTAGSTARIRRAGLLDITGLTLSEGQLYAGLGGVLATAPNLSAAFVQLVGRCIEANAAVDVDIDESLPIG